MFEHRVRLVESLSQQYRERALIRLALNLSGSLLQFLELFPFQFRYQQEKLFIKVYYLLNLVHTVRVIEPPIVLEVDECFVDFEYLSLQPAHFLPLVLTLFEEGILSHLEDHGLVCVSHVFVQHHFVNLSFFLTIYSFVAFSAMRHQSLMLIHHRTCSIFLLL